MKYLIKLAEECRNELFSSITGTEEVNLSGTSENEERWANDTGISAGMGGM